MNRTIWTRSCILLLCGLVLTAGWAEKVRKTPKTPQEIANYARNHPDAAQKQPPAPRPTTASPVPYTRPGAFNNNGQVHMPPVSNAPSHASQPYNRPGTDWSQFQQHPTTSPQAHPGQPNNQGGHVIGNDNNWSYAPQRPGQPDRAYPNRPQYGGGGRDDYGREGNGRGGNGREGNDRGGSPVRIYVSASPVYIPAPQYVSAPRPRFGNGYAYYPQNYGPSYGPWSAPDCGDIARFPLLGCEIIAADGTFLGVIDRAYNGPESIANRNSAFGSPYSRLSIWNPEGPYGSPDAPYSPWNRDSFRPPVLYWHGEFRGYLSINPNMQPNVSPALLPEHIQTSPWR